MLCSNGIFSRACRLKDFKSCVKFISSANQELILEEEHILEGLEKNTEKSDKYVKKPRVEYSSTHFAEISKYLNSKTCLQDIKDKIPPHFLLRKYKCPHMLYFVDKDVAKNVFITLKPHLESDKSHILEVNAGAGVLSNYLIQSGLPRLRIYEGDSAFFDELYIEVLRRKSEARLFKFNLLKLWTLMRLDRNDHENRVDAVFDGLPHLSWEDEPVAKIIAAIPSDSFILHIIHSIVFQSGICAHGRPEFFLIMQPQVYKKLMTKPKGDLKEYRNKSVLFQLFFESKVLRPLPEQALVPWMKKNKKKKQSTEIYEKKLLLVKLTPPADLFQRVPQHMIKQLWFFVRVIMQKRTDKVIAVLERWMPGVGIRLIAQGFTIYTECGSLKPKEILDLFLQLSSWPEYEASSFCSSMEGLLVRMSEPGDAEVIMTEEEKRAKTKAEDSSDNTDT